MQYSNFALYLFGRYLPCNCWKSFSFLVAGFRELPTTSGQNTIPHPRSITNSSSNRDDKNGFEVTPGFDPVQEEKQYKQRLPEGYNNDLFQEYGGRISPPLHRIPLEFHYNTDSGYPSTSPVRKFYYSLFNIIIIIDLLLQWCFFFFPNKASSCAIKMLNVWPELL